MLLQLARKLAAWFFILITDSLNLLCLRLREDLLTLSWWVVMSLSSLFFRIRKVFMKGSSDTRRNFRPIAILVNLLSSPHLFCCCPGISIRSEQPLKKSVSIPLSFPLEQALRTSPHRSRQNLSSLLRLYCPLGRLQSLRILIDMRLSLVKS